jgi:intracellular sulfur oxidation DsrE/DsrF family protein
MRRLFVIAFALLVGLSTMGSAQAATKGITNASSATEMHVPKPDFNHPRLLAFQMDSASPKKMNLIINNINNIMKYYGQENVKIALVAFGPGLKAYLRKSPVKARILSLTAYDNIKLLACHNTMQKMKVTKKDLLPGVQVTPAGVVKLVELQMAGWTYLAP